MPAKGTATGWVGTQAPRKDYPTPKGTPKAGGAARLARRKAPPSLKGESYKLHRAGVGGWPRPEACHGGTETAAVLRLRTPGNPIRLPGAPPGGGAGDAEAQSRRFPAEGQQQLRSAAGEGRTQPSPTSKAPAPTQAPSSARHPPRSAAPAERRKRASRGGQLQPPSREMPQPRLLDRRPGPAASAAGAHLRLRRPGRPGRAPGRCVRLRPPGKVPTAPGASG